MNACMNAAQRSTRGWDWVEMGDEVTVPVTLLAHGVDVERDVLAQGAEARVYSVDFLDRAIADAGCEADAIEIGGRGAGDRAGEAVGGASAVRRARGRGEWVFVRRTRGGTDAQGDASTDARDVGWERRCGERGAASVR